MNISRNTMFDYKTHRENFTAYLEVIIFKDGHIEYAVPSHQMKLIDIYCKKIMLLEMNYIILYL